MNYFQYFAITFITVLSFFLTSGDAQQLFLKRLQDSLHSDKSEVFSPESFKQDPSSVKDPICDCGEFSIECYYENGQKNCTCKEGYAQSKAGICEECQCGPGELKCSFYSATGYRKCTCKKGYAVTIETSEKNQTCERCDCGPHTFACILDAKENVVCTCDDNYAVTSNETGAKICKECNCGFHGKTCEFDSKGYRQCTCETGYHITSQHNWGGDQECEIQEQATAWKIATGVMSVLCAFVIALLLLALWKNSQRSR